MSASIILALVVAGAPPSPKPREEPQVIRCKAQALPTDALPEVPLEQAEAIPNGKRIRLVGYVVLEPTPYAPCPPNATCEASLPPFAYVSDQPPGTTGSGAIWVNPLPCVPRVGEHAAFVGHWEHSTQPATGGRVFAATEIALLPRAR